MGQNGQVFQVFEEFDMVAKEQVAQCVALWVATYNSGGTMRASQRFILVKAFEHTSTIRETPPNRGSHTMLF